MVGVASSRVLRRSPERFAFRALAAEIATIAPSCGRARLIAVDGPGGAGKSLFAARLARHLDDAPIVHTDDFASWDNPQGWWDRFEACVLVPLERGETLRYQAYDWSRRRLGVWREIPTRDTVIIEGVSSSRRAAVGRLAMVVWVEAPPGIRMARGIERDGESMRGMWETWMAGEDRHFRADRSVERADLVVDGSPTLAHDPEDEFLLLERPPAPGSSPGRTR
jgi:hypothetical protein